MKESMLSWVQSSLFSGGSASYLEGLYEQYIEQPESVSPAWQRVFSGLKNSAVSREEIPHSVVREHFKQIARRRVSAGHEVLSTDLKQIGVLQLINAYRKHGHRVATLDPLGLRVAEKVDALRLGFHGLSKADLDNEYIVDLRRPALKLKLSVVLERLRSTYCDTLGVEFLHLECDEEREWLRYWLEYTLHEQKMSATEAEGILYLLTAAEGLEKYIGSKFPGAKRFGLEGGESLLPMLNEIIQGVRARGGKEVVLGMAHRGRLNVLVNLMGKVPRELFDEFAGKHEAHGANDTGDVKYHQGFSADINTPKGLVHLALAFNPSHLEIVGPVVEGSVRARQVRRGDDLGDQVIPVLIHGDSAITGQGVVMETFNMSQTRGFHTGGTIHIVINNQVGFTTSRPDDTRSTRYATDVAKMVAAPVFHVNGDDPEAVVRVARLALDYRMTFGKDVIVDLYCYRRHGHNEADEPSATQPLMYQAIKKHPTVRALYAEAVVARGLMTLEDTRKLANTYRDLLDVGKNVVPSWVPMSKHEFSVDWHPFLGKEWTEPADTTLTAGAIYKYARILTQVPAEIKLQARVAKIVADRVKMYNGELPLDWGAAENMAYAGLVAEGHAIRLSGQDSGRGTFFHRHAVWHDQLSGDAYVPLNNIDKTQARFDVIDSVLSEAAVLAYEYGYATTEPRELVIWEAQFGDFANGAQVVIDQFISSGENKWGRLCGLTMLLPHGYEGQGAEHSSARLERYLQLCAQQNIQVCVPSTPAQVFHMLRRQAIRPLRKPLVVMTPKSLLRHKLAVSELADLTEGKFHTVIPEVDPLEVKKVKRVIMCSGKVYYELLQRRRAEELETVAILRIEQLYPFPMDDLKQILATFTTAGQFIWCQEEPMNQGAWYCSQHNIRACLPAEAYLEFTGRTASAAPATGLPSLHLSEQHALVEQALGLNPVGNQRNPL